MVSPFHFQIGKIIEKLAKAKESDSDLRVFGSGSHKYHLNKPADSERIENFELEYSVSLPECYRAFLEHVGNGGNGYRNSGAGPFYGLFPLGIGVEELLYSNPEEHLGKECILTPEMDQETWHRLTDLLEQEDISDHDYHREINKLYAGVLPIGSQGCSYLQGIVLNGTHKGRVVNLNMDLEIPRFAKGDNFLDWYEKWLDEIIDGTLIKSTPSWFGY